MQSVLGLNPLERRVRRRPSDGLRCELAFDRVRLVDRADAIPVLVHERVQLDEGRLQVVRRVPRLLVEVLDGDADALVWLEAPARCVHLD